jgi:hypothetical protein
METVEELGLMWVIFLVIVGLAFALRRRLQPKAGWIGVLVAIVIASVVACVMISKMHESRDRSRMDHVEVFGAECSEKTPGSPDLAALRELMCANDTRNAALRGSDVEIGVMAHKDLLGMIPLQRAPAGDAVVALGPDGAILATIIIDPTKGFSYLRDPKLVNTTRVRLVAAAATVVEAALVR